MTATILTESLGLIKFATRASAELSAWFGPHCNHDHSRIASMTAREWDGMDDLEKRPFIMSEPPDETQAKSNPFMSFLLEKYYSPLKRTSDQAVLNNTDIDANLQLQLKLLGQDWTLVTKETKGPYLTNNQSDLGMARVIDKRAKLHEIYPPRELSTLELILKTKPKLPLSARVWFIKDSNLSIKSPEIRDAWMNLDKQKREIFEKCAILDRKRYSFEKSAWLTKLLTINYDSDDLTSKDFQAQEAMARLESVGSLLELCRDLPSSLVGVRRPRGPFSLFIEAYRYQIRDERPEFQFGRHLRECGEAWAKLSEEEKDVYRLQSKKLKEARLELMKRELKLDKPNSLTIDFFDINRSLHGPCRPSHLLPRLMSPVSIWAKENNIKARDRATMWNNLSQCNRDHYEQEHRRLKASIERTKLELKEKLNFVKSLINEAKQLEDLKRKLRLINVNKK